MPGPESVNGERPDIRTPAPARPLAAVLVVAAYALLWAVVEVLAFSTRVGIEQLVWTRYGVHLLFMAAVLGPRRGASLVRTQRPALQVLRSLTMLAMPASYLLASSYLPARDILAAFWAAPLLLLALTRDHQPHWRWAWALAAFAATVVLLRPGVAAITAPVVLSLAMAVSFALYVRLTDDLSGDSTAANLFHSGLWVFIALTPRMPYVWQSPEPAGWLLLGAVGLLGLLSLFLIDVAVRWGGTAVFVPVVYLQPVFHLLITSGGRDIGRRALAAMALVAVAAAVAAAREGRAGHRTEAAR